MPLVRPLAYRSWGEARTEGGTAQRFIQRGEQEPRHQAAEPRKP